MAVRFELVSLALPPALAPETLPPAVAVLIAACWPGMSRAQLLDRARRAGLRVSLHLQRDTRCDDLTCVRVTLTPRAAGDDSGSIELTAHVRRQPVAGRRRRAGVKRATPSLPPARDARQLGLF